MSCLQLVVFQPGDWSHFQQQQKVSEFRTNIFNYIVFFFNLLFCFFPFLKVLIKSFHIWSRAHRTHKAYYHLSKLTEDFLFAKKVNNVMVQILPQTTSLFFLFISLRTINWLVHLGSVWATKSTRQSVPCTFCYNVHFNKTLAFTCIFL